MNVLFVAQLPRNHAKQIKNVLSKLNSKDVAVSKPATELESIWTTKSRLEYTYRSKTEAWS